MITDQTYADSVLPRIADTMRLTRRLEEVKAAIAGIDAGEPMRLVVGSNPIRLSDQGQVDIMFAVRADLDRHKREIEEELAWRAGK
ncbi:hypothetical protein GGQ99_004733 [Aminobacter niigataensis]|uniref:Uncharacterized protein n=1 Tax=Aminobacter niigataensis TaxID=83265 RepID=A0ABR6L9T1_9HYPH|nr:hypothetical protein [Aminobacter niigataensis]MBB4652949.1 hypothetical protein [Aminobacter niigataensis]